MQKKKATIWSSQLGPLENQTRTCKICFKPIKENSFFNCLHPQSSICNECLKRFEPKFLTFKIDGIKGMAIYEYDDEIRNLLYQFKGCYDIELKDIFLEKFRIELFLWYFSYVIVPVPSFSDEDNRRGFNHVLEIFKTLKLPIVKVLSKVSQFKQADHTAEQRKQILKHLEIDTSVNLKNKSVLLVDDVFTTGSTIKACISLIKQLKPKRIDVLVMSKTVLKDK